MGRLGEIINSIVLMLNLEDMKIKLLSLLVLLLTCKIASAQSDTLNRLDANNEKIGWWKVYLDKDLGKTEDLSKAIYFKYSYFVGKFDYYSMGRIGTKRNPVSPVLTKVNDVFMALDGEYKANFSDGQPRFILIAQDGKLQEYKEFYKNGKVKHVFKYNETCGDTSFHYCIYLYKKDGTLKTKTTLRSPKK